MEETSPTERSEADESGARSSALQRQEPSPLQEGSSRKVAQKEMIESAATVYYEFCRRVARLLNRRHR